MQILIDESIDDGDFKSMVGEISYTVDNGGRVYLSWNAEGIETEIGINLSDVLKFIQEELLDS